MRASSLSRSLVAAALALMLAAPAHAELRISGLEVWLDGRDVTVHGVLLGALPDGIREGGRGGIPAHVRLTVERWRHRRSRRDQLLTTKTVAWTLAGHVVT